MANPTHLFPPLFRILGTGRHWGNIGTGCVETDPRRSASEWSRQGSFALNLVVAGEGRLIGPGARRTRLEPGVAYHHFPDRRDLTLEWREGSGPVIEWFMILDRRTFQRWDDIGLIPGRFAYPKKETRTSLTLFEQLHGLLKTTSQRSPGEGIGLLLPKLLAVIGNLYASLRPEQEEPAHSSMIREAMLRLQQSVRQRIPVATVARELGIPYPTLRRRFRQETGLSLIAWQIERRLEEASRLLATHRIQEVAEMMGYSDAFSFSHQFKQHFGLSPRDYQQTFLPPSGH